MYRFYTPAVLITPSNTFSITKPDEIKHLRVLRYKRGDSIISFDGKNKEYSGIITRLAKEKVDIEVTKVTEYDMSDSAKVFLAGICGSRKQGPRNSPQKLLDHWRFSPQKMQHRRPS